MNKFMSIVCGRIKVRLIRTFKKVQLSPKNKSKTESDIDPYFRDLSNFLLCVNWFNLKCPLIRRGSILNHSNQHKIDPLIPQEIRY